MVQAQVGHKLKKEDFPTPFLLQKKYPFPKVREGDIQDILINFTNKNEREKEFIN